MDGAGSARWRSSLTCLIGTVMLLVSIAGPTAVAEGSTVFSIHGVAGVAGKNYEPELSSEAVDLEGQTLVIQIDGGWNCEDAETSCLPDRSTR